MNNTRAVQWRDLRYRSAARATGLKSKTARPFAKQATLRPRG